MIRFSLVGWYIGCSLSYLCSAHHLNLDGCVLCRCCQSNSLNSLKKDGTKKITLTLPTFYN